MLDLKMKTMTGYTSTIGQGSVKPMRDSKLSRDTADVAKLKTFLSERMVFDPYVVSQSMKSIASGVVAPSNVNIDKAFSVGIEIMKSLEGANPITAKIPKSALCIQMPSKAAVSTLNQIPMILMILIIIIFTDTAVAES